MRLAILASGNKLFFALCELQRLFPMLLFHGCFPRLRWFPHTHALTSTQQETQRNPLQISGYLCFYLFFYFSLSPLLLPFSCLTLLWYSVLKTLAALAPLDSLAHLLNSERLLNSTWFLLCAAAWELSQDSRLKLSRGSPWWFSLS